MRSRGFNKAHFSIKKAYAIALFPAEMFDNTEHSLYTTISNLPEIPDIITYCDYEFAEQAITTAVESGVRIVFPAYGESSPRIIKKAQTTGVELIEQIGMLQAYRRLIE